MRIVGSIQSTSLATASEYRRVTIYSWFHSNHDVRNPMIPSAVILHVFHINEPNTWNSFSDRSFLLPPPFHLSSSPVIPFLSPQLLLTLWRRHISRTCHPLAMGLSYVVWVDMRGLETCSGERRGEPLHAPLTVQKVSLACVMLWCVPHTSQLRLCSNPCIPHLPYPPNTLSPPLIPLTLPHPPKPPSSP